MLVKERLVPTALHVVGNRKLEPPQPYPGECVVSFSGGQAKTRCDPARFPRSDDSACESYDFAIDVERIPTCELNSSNVAREMFGCPDKSPINGMVRRGSVENHSGA